MVRKTNARTATPAAAPANAPAAADATPLPRARKPRAPKQRGGGNNGADIAVQAGSAQTIRVRGARQNNLQNLTVEVPVGKLTVVTGVSGSGKSSLVFDTIYAEGQRRYIETFSSYARQFLDRLPPPAVDSVEGIPPAIAIRQLNPIRNFRSTVGTMTELQDYIKTLYAACARLFCPHCGREIVRDNPDSVFEDLLRRGLAGQRVGIAFTVDLAGAVSREEALNLLSAQGYTRVTDDPEAPPTPAPPPEPEPAKPKSRTKAKAKTKTAKAKSAVRRKAASATETPAAAPVRHIGRLRVLLDLVTVAEEKRPRIVESLEKAFSLGHGRIVLLEDPGRGAARVEVPPVLAHYSSLLECPECGRTFEPPAPNLFSFNSPIGACPECRGFGRVIGISEALVIPDPGKSIAEGCVKPFQTETNRVCQRMMLKRAKELGYDVNAPYEQLPEEVRTWMWKGETKSWRSGKWPGIDDFFEWLESRAYKMHVRVMLSRYREYTLCKTCGGTRLREEALAWKLVAPDGTGRTVPELCAAPIEDTLDFLTRIEAAATPGTPAGDTARTLLADILPRLRYLVEVGLGYLTLDRPSRTLSGGEAQRIALTTALGSHLVGTLFVLDEPSVGLHPRDIGRLIGILRQLRDAGNTLLVVEHDPAVILAADHIIELGPGPGEQGGRVILTGDVPALLASPASPSAPWLLAERKHALPAAAPAAEKPAEGALRLIGATEHNLRDVSLELPLHRLVVVTGVSGSGKSTLVCDVLYPALRRRLGLPPVPGLIPGACRDLEGAELLANAALVDQSPIGKSSRSTPGSYIGAFDEIRKLFAALPEAKARGFGPGDFSFNSGLGRCPDCEGTGFEHIEMQFLSDVYLPCEKCGGTRYRPEILSVQYPAGGRSLSIADVLNLTAEEAAQLFAARPAVTRLLQPLIDVGLGYLRLGQPVPTLSGGEAQRLKLAGFLVGIDPEAARATIKLKGARARGSLLLFDEPTTGLHFSDIETLLRVFRRLLSDGHSLLVIEHNLQVIRAADWLIDLGPGGGELGGRIVATGTPEDFLQPDVPGETAAALRGAFTPETEPTPSPAPCTTLSKSPVRSGRKSKKR